jgi:Gas vesicle protein
MGEDKRISYFLLGLGVGVAAGILLAPKSGRETRDLLRSKADEGKDYLRRRSEEVKESAEELLERGRAALVRQKEQLAAAVDAGKQAYREAVAGKPAAETSAEGV